MARPPLLPDFDLWHTVLDLKTDLVIPVSQSRRRPALLRHPFAALRPVYLPDSIGGALRAVALEPSRDRVLLAADLADIRAANLPSIPGLGPGLVLPIGCLGPFGSAVRTVPGPWATGKGGPTGPADAISQR